MPSTVYLVMTATIIIAELTTIHHTTHQLILTSPMLQYTCITRQQIPKIPCCFSNIAITPALRGMQVCKRRDLYLRFRHQVKAYIQHALSSRAKIPHLWHPLEQIIDSVLLCLNELLCSWDTTRKKIDQRTAGLLLLTWMKFNPTMDK